MKKLLVIIAALAVQTFAFAQPTDVNRLPKAAQETVKKHLSHLTITSVESEMSISGRQYEVDFACGGEADFDSNGKLTKIKCPAGVPDALVNAKIRSYVAKNYKGTKITSMDIEGNKIDIDLTNDIDLVFNLSGNFIRVDD